MAAANSTSYDSFLKDMWPKKAIQNLTLDDNVTWGMIDKFTDWTGDKYHLPLGYGDTGGFSADFNTAQANKQPTSEAEFQLTAATSYSLFSIQRKLIKQSRDAGAVAEALGRQSTSAMNTWKRLHGIYLFGNGGGSLATVASYTPGALTFTVSTSAQAARLEKGYTIQSATTDGTSGTVNAGSGLISAVDIGTKTITSAVAWDTSIPNFTANDYVFIDGTFGAMITGFDAWIPSSAPSATLFFGLDRTANPTRLGGLRLTATGLSPRAAAKRAALEVWKAGGKADWYVLAPEDFMNLSNDLESSGNLVRTAPPSGKLDGMTFGIKYDAIQFMGPTGPINVTCDYNATDGTGWMLTKKTWRIVGIGDFPYFDDMGGGRLMKEGNADAYEGRIVADIQVGCDAPGFNCRVTF